MGEPAPALPGYASGAEFAAILAAMAAQLHAKNRIWLDESGFAFEVAELLRRVGALFEQGLADPEVPQLFGDAYRSASLDREGRRDWLRARLFPSG
jgi:hypothetical protein